MKQSLTSIYKKHESTIKDTAKVVLILSVISLYIRYNFFYFYNGPVNPISAIKLSKQLEVSSSSCTELETLIGDLRAKQSEKQISSTTKAISAIVGVKPKQTEEIESIEKDIEKQAGRCAKDIISNSVNSTSILNTTFQNFSTIVEGSLIDPNSLLGKQTIEDMVKQGASKEEAIDYVTNIGQYSFYDTCKKAYLNKNVSNEDKKECVTEMIEFFLSH